MPMRAMVGGQLSILAGQMPPVRSRPIPIIHPDRTAIHAGPAVGKALNGDIPPRRPPTMLERASPNKRPPETRMSPAQPQEPYYTRDAFRRWCAAQTSGRYERVNGHIIAMAPERIGHVRAKNRVVRALERAIRESGVPCEAMADGVTVETGDSDYEPDALVNYGPPPDDDAISATNPVVIIEVLSPTTASTDTGGKLVDYFQIPSVAHYLIIHPAKQAVIHHRREEPGGIATRILTSGAIQLDPPGISVTVEEFYPAD
jgi:Uma2 family endonuclease